MRAGQADREFGELARRAVNRDRATMLLGDDVIGDRQPEPRSFTGRLCRHEGLEQFFSDLGRDAGAVVARPHLDHVAEIAHRHSQGRPEIWRRIVTPPPCRRIKAVADQILAEARSDRADRASPQTAILPRSGTFHSVGSRLLRLHAPSIGLDPSFTILDAPIRRISSMNGLPHWAVTIAAAAGLCRPDRPPQGRGVRRHSRRSSAATTAVADLNSRSVAPALARVEHIFLGYDHVAFLAAVVLWARRLWPVVKVVTAFTIAHSITLFLAALDVLHIPSAIIEPAIAASIIYVAAENFLSCDIDKRWRDTFGFGLIHGFGFASALQEFGLPRRALVPALASFNLGVEIGQIGIVCLVVPALLGMDRLVANWRGETVRTTRSAVAVYGISAVIIALGSYWFLARTLLTA